METFTTKLLRKPWHTTLICFPVTMGKLAWHQLDSLNRMHLAFMTQLGTHLSGLKTVRAQVISMQADSLQMVILGLKGIVHCEDIEVVLG